MPEKASANIFDSKRSVNDYDFYFNGVKIEGGGGITPSGTKNITENGTHNVYDYEYANVNVPQGITPTGTTNITENGTYDVTQYASAVVNVQGGGGAETLTHSWDFTQSATDSVGGMTAVLHYCTTDSNGLHLIGEGDYVTFPQDLFKANFRIEIDIASYDRQGTAHGRALMFTNNNTGIVYRNTGQWGAYITNADAISAGWVMIEGATATSFFDGHTLKLVSDEYGIVKVYRDTELLMTTPRPMTGFIELGSSSGSAYNMTITAMRVYENV